MFNEKQEEAIKTLKGRIRIIAGAGSGKTSVLTNRYVELVKSGVSTKNILCVTFTNKAANEMKERITKLLDRPINSSLICTFHGFCLKVLKESISLLGYPNNFIILDSEDQKTILKKIYKNNKINYEDLPYADALSIIVNRKVNKEDHLLDMICLDQTIKKLYEKAHKDLKRFNKNGEDFDLYDKYVEDCIYYGYLLEQQKNTALDFNDLILYTVLLFEQEPKILNKWAKRLEYIMVDEFQDTSEKQGQLIDMLSKKHGNLFVVGDPDQTIYSWRGARPEILVNFDKQQETKTIIMNQNYRSTPQILNVANKIIAKNKLRVPKDLFTENKDGRKIYKGHFSWADREGKWIVETIKTLLEKYKPQDIAILYRMHFLSRFVEEELIKSRIPYIIYSGINFYERKEIKDILAYLRLVNNTNDDLALERIINTPSRGIGVKKLEKIQQVAKDNNCSLFEATRILSKEDNKLEDFITLIFFLRSKVGKMSLYDFTQFVIQTIEYSRVLKQETDIKEREENIKELLKSMQEFMEENKEYTLDDYMQNIALLTNTDKKEKKEGVSLMTIHSSKGLEFPVVFVCGMTEGLFPSCKAETEQQIEEERRLAYVAYTRAKEILIVTDSEGKDFNGEPKVTSRFVTEIIEDE